MAKELTNKKLIEALIKAQSEMTSAVATGTNPHFKSEYAPLDEVIKAVKKPLNRNGIFFLQKVYVADNGQCVETEFHGHDAVLKGGKVFVKCDKSTAQGYGSSLSYAKRYSLQTACGLPTGDDDDANASTDEVKPVAKKVEKKVEKKSDDWKVDSNTDKAMVFVNGFLSIAKEFSKGGSSAERREMIASHWKANTKDITFLKKNFSDLHVALAEDIKTIINQEEK
ncbi:ERF family protein [uncultured Maribacter sp.]|uniref:ERF family protein n=1 Tax=uncultured Maribacter sp. TaxID=431308 RepID=UPI0030EF189F|tara:strand:+ start:2287 stop:2961 length:675 start_codon:yes stop_codon:yes gene_type:complete